MWVANKPNIQTAISDIDLVIAADKKGKLCAEDKPTIALLYQQYDVQQGSITNAQHQSFDNAKAKALHRLYSKTYNGQPLDFIRKDLMDSVSLCPYCSIGQTETLDHFMAESEYEELAVCRLNLVPLCYECNRKKRALPYTDFVHPYYSGLPKDKQFFICDTNIDQSGNLTWTFQFDLASLGKPIFDKLTKQAQHTGVFSRISHASNVFMSNNFMPDYVCDEAFYKQIEVLKYHHQVYGKNDWRNALLTAIENDTRINAKVINQYTSTHPALINKGGVI